MVALYFVMGLFWLLLGGALLLDYYVFGGVRWTLPFGGSNISLGWFGIGLAVYNFIRAWSFRVTRRQKDALIDAVQRRYDQLAAERREQHREPEPPNPVFDFRSPPANPEQRDRPV